MRSLQDKKLEVEIINFTLKNILIIASIGATVGVAISSTILSILGS